MLSNKVQTSDVKTDVPALIKAKNISKIYELGYVGKTISANAPTKKTALHPLDFEIYPNESIGVFGQNGAGKSTLLALLSEAIIPSTGVVSTRGILAPLLQLTAWLDLEDTGRANVETFAAINGLTGSKRRSLVERAKEFSDIGKFFDAPVRTYSSGMVARLAFGAAINIDADVLLIDEIIAVGDSNFRARCYAALKAKAESGSAIIIVSQSPGALMNIATRGVVLDDGKLEFDGPINDAAEVYSDIIQSRQKRGGQVIEKHESLLISQNNYNGFHEIKVRVEGLQPGEIYDVDVNYMHHRNIEVGTISGSFKANDTGLLIARLPVSSRLNSGSYLLNVLVRDKARDLVVKEYHNAFRLDLVRQTNSIGIVDLNIQIKVVG